MAILWSVNISCGIIIILILLIEATVSGVHGNISPIFLYVHKV